MMMEKWYFGETYTFIPFEDDDAGCGGIELFMKTEGEPLSVCKATYWDAVGHFVFEMSVGELPVDVLEWFFAEARKAVPLE